MIVYADDLSFLRVVNEPKRYVGRTRINFLREYSEQNNCSLYNSLLNNMGHKLIINTDAKQFVNLVEKYSKLYKEMRLSDLLSSILDESGYEAMLRLQGEQERLDNLSELKQSVFDFEKTSGEENTLEEYLQNVALFTNMDKIEKKESVKMMTVHAAKGLEFPYVFLCELNEGIFPTSHTNTLEKLEEERRLAYVAYTRAENALFLSDAEGTNSDKSYRFPSRFIFNTDKEFLDYESELEEMFEENARLYIENNEKKLNGNNLNEMLKVGDLIEHDVFGTGRIVGVWIKKQSYVIKFDKFKTVRNISFQISLKKLK